MKIDAHQHFWSFNPTDFPWISAEMEVLRRDYHIEQAIALLDAHSFDGVVAVQARADWAENDWLLSLAKQSPRIAGIVGWADLFNDAAQPQVEALLAQPQCIGVRAMLQDMPAPAQAMQDTIFNRYVAQIQTQGAVYEVLLRHDQLQAVVPFCQAHDRHALVIDHLAKPDYAAGLSSEAGQQWLSVFQQLARLPHVYVKTSGLLTEVEALVLSGATEATEIDLYFTPFLDAALELFGAHRLVFGSDWPVAHLRGGYDVGLGVIERWAEQRLSAAEAAQLFGANAQRLYSI